MGIGFPAMQCHEQGWIGLALGHPVLACLIRIVIANEARRSRFLTVVEKRDCFVAWDNLHSIRRKALRFSALPGYGHNCCPGIKGTGLNEGLP